MAQAWRLPSGAHPVADAATILGAYDVAGWGLASRYNGSVQGVTFDTSDNSLWAVLKATAGGGAWLLHIAPDGGLIGAPVALPSPAANGIVHDPNRDLLLILFIASPATVRPFSKAGVDLSAGEQVLTLPDQGADHLAIDPASGELLVSRGANGKAGTIGRCARADGGGWAPIGVDTLTGADAIEGIVAFGDKYHVINDGTAHPGTP